MKPITYHVYITSAEDFLEYQRADKLAHIYGQRGTFVTTDKFETLPDGWVAYAGEFTVAFDGPEFSEPALLDAAIASLDNEIKETRAKAQRAVEELEQKKQSLMAIEHKPEPTDPE